jgi:hypothetical protein
VKVRRASPVEVEAALLGQGLAVLEADAALESLDPVDGAVEPRTPGGRLATRARTRRVPDPVEGAEAPGGAASTSADRRPEHRLRGTVVELSSALLTEPTCVVSYEERTRVEPVAALLPEEGQDLPEDGEEPDDEFPTWRPTRGSVQERRQRFRGSEARG